MIAKIPPLVQRVKDTLKVPKKPKDYKALLDLGQSMNDRWALWLTKGIYYFQDTKREVSPVRISIDPKDYTELTNYSIFYNPLSNTYEVKKGNYKDLHDNINCIPGYFVGGFMFKKCSLSFILPQDECIRYIRAFSQEFDPNFDIEEEYIDLCNKYCSEFNFEYNEDFNTKCSYILHDEFECNTLYSIFDFYDINKPIKCQLKEIT